MLKSYLTVALRALRRHAGYTVLNLLGLAIGMAASLLILQYVRFELSYDDFHEDADRIYRVRYDFVRDGELVFKSATTFPKVGPALQEEFPEVEANARLYLRYGGGVVRVGAESYKEDNLFQADASFLTMFDYPMPAGDPATALVEPNTAVLSTDIARKYFGDADPIGRTIRFGSEETYTVTGVIKSPENSHLKIDFLLSYPTLVQLWGEDFDTAWGWYDFYNYIRLAPGADPEALEAKLPDFVARHDSDGDAARLSTVFRLQALPDIHLHSDLIQEARVNGDADRVYFLGLIAVFILIIAWVNYVNLATARAVERAREIGVRKVLGAQRGQLVGQFLLEALVLNLLAAVFAYALMGLALPFFNRLAGSALTSTISGGPLFWVALAAFLIGGALLSGLYPAFVLAAYRPVTTLKGRFAGSRRGFGLRQGLVVAQFMASVGLIAGTLIVYQQLSFMRSQELGIDLEQVLVLEAPGVVAVDSLYPGQATTFKESVRRNPRIRNVASSSEVPGNLIYWTNGARRLSAPPESSTILYRVGIDYAYFDTYGHEVLAGRGFTPEFTADDRSVVLNETALRALDLPGPEDAVGERVVVGGDTLTVVGVVADYHQEGLQKGFDQIGFFLRPDIRRFFSVKLETEGVAETMAFLEEEYARVFPGNPFSYFFLDSYFDRQYRGQERFGQVFGFFALLAILVACLGLFGLAAFTAAQRTKEIGIRKVLGSSVGGIIVLLSKDYLKLVALASLIASPLVWLLMRRWLEGFAFRIDLGVGVFVAAALLALAIALATVSVQSIRAARANPVDALRYE